MSSTNKTAHYELSQYIGTDKPTYLSDYNGDMLKIDTGIHDAASDASTALSTANSAASTASTASTNASAAVTTANTALSTANSAASTASTASTNAGAALTAAQAALTAAEANTIENLAPAYDPTLTYDVGDLVTYIDAQGSGKLYECIIAVTSPEAFNINKWDDKTTSEVYGRAGKVLYKVDGNGIITFKEALDTIFANINLNDIISKDSQLVLRRKRGVNDVAISAMSRISSTFIDFNWTFMYPSGGALRVINEVYHLESSGSYCKSIDSSYVGTTITPSIEDKDSSVLAAGTYIEVISIN